MADLRLTWDVNWDMVRTLTLTAVQEQEIVAHILRELPNEACGLLGGEGGIVRRVYPVANVARSRWEYLMDPLEQVRVMLEIEAAGWELSAIYHSHPAGPATPSATDVERAYYPGSVYVIVSPSAGGVWSPRGFLIDEGRVQEVEIALAP